MSTYLDILDPLNRETLERGDPKTNEPISSLNFDSSVEGVMGSSISSGGMISNLTIQGGYLQSNNFVSGSAGWQFTPTSAEINVSTAILSLDIPDTTTANSFHTNSTGNSWWGCDVADFASNNDNAAAYILNTGATKLQSLTVVGGVIDGTSTIGGRTASALATAIDASSHFADDAINTAAGTILGSFTFSGSGALQIGTYINGTSGDLKLSPTGILARDSAGDTTFSINAETGVAVLNGLVVGTNVGIGTAEDSAGVTTIVGNTITAGYITALSLVVGTEIGLGTAQDSAGVTTIVGNTVTTGFVNALSVVAGSVLAENITGTTITGKTFRTADTGVARLEIIRAGVSSANFIAWKNSANTIKASIYSDASGAMAILADAGITIQSSVLPYSTNNYDLGSSSYRWDDLYLNNQLDFGATANSQITLAGTIIFGMSTAQVACNKNFFPNNSNTYDLGSSSFKWQNLYLSGNIVVDGNVDGVDISAHAANASAHHTKYTDTNARSAVTGTALPGNLVLGSNDITGVDDLYINDIWHSSTNIMDFENNYPTLFTKIDMNNNNVDGINTLSFDTNTGSPSSAGQIQYYDSGGVQQFRCKVGTYVGSIDLSNV